MSELSFRQQVSLIVLDKLVIAAVLIAVGLYVNEHFELFKNQAAAQQKADGEKREQARERASAEMVLIQRQLNDLYYPLYFRLAKDDEVWTLMQSQQKYGVHVEHDTVLANNKQVLSLLENHTNLLFRPNEPRDQALVKAILNYERHMAIYRALQASGDKRRPADVSDKFDYPNEICTVVERHVGGLEEELLKLRSDTPSTAAPLPSQCRPYP
jgi:hypothetical protein